MRVYANLIQNLALFDLPRTKYDQNKNSYVERIFKQLLIYDQQADNDFEAVLREAASSEKSKDPGFQAAYLDAFEQYIVRGRHHARWEKIRKDYNAYVDWETKRRNTENPYDLANIMDQDAWDTVPDFSRQKKHRPYQFDHLYRDAQALAGQVHELTKNYKELNDKDLFRAKVNSILLPGKIIFALSGNGNSDFAESQIMVVDLKIAMDAYKLGYDYLNRLIESLHKISWSQQSNQVLRQSISFAELLAQRLKSRVIETERNFMLYLDMDFNEE